MIKLRVWGGLVVKEVASASECSRESFACPVDETIATGRPHIWAAGDCIITHHRLLGETYQP